MIKNRFLLDTNAIIYLTTKGNAISSDLENELNESDLFISVITEMELFSWPDLPPNEEEKLRAFIFDKISVIELTTDVKNETIAFRRKTRHKLPDCIIAATAIVSNTVLITEDKRLLNISLPKLKIKRIF